MILADTSVWIDYFNGRENKYTDILDSHLDGDTVAMGDLIFLEILQGFKNYKDYSQAKSTLKALGQYEMLGSKIALQCADNYRFLRKVLRFVVLMAIVVRTTEWLEPTGLN